MSLFLIIYSLKGFACRKIEDILLTRLWINVWKQVKSNKFGFEWKNKLTKYGSDHTTKRAIYIPFVKSTTNSTFS